MTNASTTRHASEVSRLSARELLAAMVSIPSVNPLLTASPTAPDERDLASFVADYLRRWDIAVQVRDVADGRSNVVAHIDARGSIDDNTVLLSAHMDTYPSYGPRSQYQPIVIGDRMFGRGSADAKASLAAMMVALVDASQSTVRRETYLTATIDEECFLTGAYDIAQSGIRADLAITGEPTQLRPVIAQKGIIRGAFRIDGRRMHAAYPSGIAAVGVAAAVVGALEGLRDDFAARDPHPRLGTPTVVVTRVETNGTMNLVANEVRVWFDARFVPGISPAAFAEMLREAVLKQTEQLRSDDANGIDIELEPLSFVSPANEAAMGSPLVRTLEAAITAECGECLADSFSYGSEAGVLSDIATDALVFGPGDPSYSHAEEEAVQLTEVDSAAVILTRLLTTPVSAGRLLECE